MLTALAKCGQLAQPGCCMYASKLLLHLSFDKVAGLHCTCLACSGTSGALRRRLKRPKPKRTGAWLTAWPQGDQPTGLITWSRRGTPLHVSLCTCRHVALHKLYANLAPPLHCWLCSEDCLVSSNASENGCLLSYHICCICLFDGLTSPEHIQS